MSQTYSQDDIAYGINTLKAFYNAWPYNSGVTYSGFQGDYSDFDLGNLGQAAKLLPSMTAVTGAMTTLATSYGLQDPPLSDLLQGLVNYMQAHGLSIAVGQELVQSANTITNAVNNLPSEVSSLANFITSPSFLIFMGLSVTALLAVLFMPEIKTAAKGAGKAYGDATEAAKKVYSDASESAKNVYSDVKTGTRRAGERIGIRA